MIVQRTVIKDNKIINPIYVSKALYNLQGFYPKIESDAIYGNLGENVPRYFQDSITGVKSTKGS